MDEKQSTNDYNPRDAAEEGAWLTFVEPDGVATTTRVWLMGSDCDAYVEKSREIQKRNNREFERSRKLKMTPPEQMEADQIDLLVAVTKGWEKDGQAQQINFETLRKFYRDRPDFKEQAELFVHDRASFFKRAAKS